MPATADLIAAMLDHPHHAAALARYARDNPDDGVRVVKAGPPPPGKVAQTGDDAHPGRWVNPPAAAAAPPAPRPPAPGPPPAPVPGPTPAALAAGDAKFGAHTFDSLPDFSNGYDAKTKSAAPAVRDTAAAAIASFTPGELAAVVGYTGLEYEDTNAQMRRCPPAFGCLNDQAKGRASAVEAGIAKAGAFAEPVHVYRAVNMRSADGAAALLDAFRAAQAAGGDVTLPSLQSTSLAKKAAVNFGEADAHAVVYYIKAKTGLYADSISEGRGEQEVIKSAGSKYKVVNVASQPGRPHLVELLEV